MTTPSPAELVKYLRDYKQADEEGVVVLASRQAIEEAASMIEALVKERDELKKTLSQFGEEG